MNLGRLGRHLLVGVAVQQAALGAEPADVGLEMGPVLRLVTGRLGLGQEEGDGRPAGRLPLFTRLRPVPGPAAAGSDDGEDEEEYNAPSHARNDNGVYAIAFACPGRKLVAQVLGE
jgi:hypothetical protein